MSDNIQKKNGIKRLITGFIVGLISLTCIIAGGWALLLLIYLISIVGSLEFVKILNHKGFYPFKTVIMFFSILFITLTSMGQDKFIPILVVAATITAFITVILKGRQPYIANVATTALGFLYCGCIPSYIMMIRQLEMKGNIFSLFEMNSGIVFFLLYFFGVLMTDVGAYYIGRKYGKHQLAPVISPNKTIEGSFGGIFATLVICIVIGYYTGLSIIHSVLLGFLISIFAQLGDLAESLMKRDAGVKDSGDSLPGHGGFLDRVDGYLFTAPIVYYYVYYFILNKYMFIDLWEKVLHVFG